MLKKYAQLYIADAAAGLPPEPPPAPSPEPKTGIAAAMAQFDDAVLAPDPSPESSKPAPDAPAAKPDAKTPAPEPKPDKPAADMEVVGEGLWKTAPKHLKNDHYKFKRETEAKITQYESRVKELESKANQSPADLKRIKDLEERSAQLEKDLSDRESRLIQADYSKSDEFKRLYVDKGTRAYNKAVADIKNLKVKSANAETGEESERPATQADFDALRKLDPYEQDRKLDEMFGSSAKRVALHINMLNSIEDEANEAIATAREKSAAKEKEQSELAQKNGAEFETYSKQAMDELVKSHPGYFAPDETNPEASKALENGFKFVDDAAKNSGTMSPKVYAETTAIIRGMAAAAPRLMIEKKQMAAKITGLEAELAKYRKSSPTSGNINSTAAAPAPEGKQSIASMAKAFDDLD